MGRLTELMREHLASISDEELQQNLAKIKSLGLGGMTAEEMFPELIGIESCEAPNYISIGIIEEYKEEDGLSLYCAA